MPNRIAAALTYVVVGLETSGLGQTMRVDDGAGAAAALLVDGAVIHLAAFDMGHA
jgi:hypothetical protein